MPVERRRKPSGASRWAQKQTGRRRSCDTARLRCVVQDERLRAQPETIALRFLRARTRTFTLAGLAGRSCSSPVKGFLTPF
jgi:hypothetical protein